MREITLEELLEAGCHFGHQVTRSNPKARDFVFEARDNIQIIDLAKTKEGLEQAAAFIKELAEKGGSLLIVGTKRQAQGILDQEIVRARELLKNGNPAQNGGLYYVTNRWIGGVLTNLSEVSKNFKKLNDLKEKLVSPEEKAKYTKREVGLWDKERQRLEVLYGGVSGLKEKPDAMFIIDSHLEDLAVREARVMGVTTVAIVDTNADPSVIDYPIPANDDAVGSIQLIVTYIMDAWVEGRKEHGKRVQKEAEKTLKEQEKAKEKPESKVQNPEGKGEKPEKESKSNTSAKPVSKTKPKNTKADKTASKKTTKGN